jgi:hypothetical protein
MPDDKKLVIKINYPNKDGALPEPIRHNIEYITEWNIKRVAGAIAALCLLIALGGYFWINGGTDADNYTAPSLPADAPSAPLPPAPELSHDNEAKAIIATNGNEKPAAPAIETPAMPSIANAGPEHKTGQQPVSETRTIASAANGQVVRGGLAKYIIHKEPFGNVSLPLQLGKKDRQKLYYFTELKDMSGQQVYHEWLYKGKSVFKRPIRITERRWRTSTHKSIGSNALGDWSVRLTGANGEIMHRIDFKVIAANND